MTFVQTIDLSIWNVKRLNPRLEHWGLLYVNNQEVGGSHCSGRNLKRLTLLRSGLRWRDTGSQWDLWQSWRARHHGFAKVTGSKHWILLASWEGHVSNSGLITYPAQRSNPLFQNSSKIGLTLFFSKIPTMIINTVWFTPHWNWIWTYIFFFLRFWLCLRN